jgi:hypothetical protein
MNVGGGEHRMVQVAEPFFIESAFNSTLAVGELLVYLGIHSKSLSVGVDDGVATSSDAAESQRISSFFSYFPRRTTASSLDQGLVSVRAPVGDVNMADERCAVGRGIAAVRHTGGSRSYTHHAMHFLKEEFENFDGDGTLFGSMGKTDFEDIKHVAPPIELISVFEKQVYSFDERILMNERQSRNLAALRDALLPRLLSGELRVKGMEKKMEEIA